jgi:hypothetical protein
MRRGSLAMIRYKRKSILHSESDNNHQTEHNATEQIEFEELLIAFLRLSRLCRL